MSESKKGWAQPIGTKKFHYFVDGRALCGKWAFFGRNLDEDEGTTSPDDCKACAKKMEKRRAKAPQ